MVTNQNVRKKYPIPLHLYRSFTTPFYFSTPLYYNHMTSASATITPQFCYHLALILLPSIGTTN